jgi:ferredoxin
MLRREFIRQAALITAWVTAGLLPFGFSRLLATEERGFKPHQRLRPPGAILDDEKFVEACIGCGLCGEVCPPRCIFFYDRAGGANINTPFINPENKACILCNKCMEVCPTEALTLIPREDVRMGIAQIDRSACYPWVDRGICGACVVVCPLGDAAIDFDFANIYRPIVQKGCVGCGQCVEVCPEPSLPIRIVDHELGSIARHSV